MNTTKPDSRLPHPDCDGSSFGWIEGCTLNIQWANNDYFDEKRACELVHAHNEQQAAIKAL